MSVKCSNIESLPDFDGCIPVRNQLKGGSIQSIYPVGDHETLWAISEDRLRKIIADNSEVWQQKESSKAIFKAITGKEY